ncbi:conserved hypothetical protein [Leishmania mexicana MHOM/GT/2001/U1103]|uniref:Uncharacterized protein n=1 Tax=Leishmania mexicana (strain MHOM/GT/2001/U1103) TaxID=929439 RepID=E9B534_LEIMU|nr:conserved hypothetical protein [Leishmania mexicana MHOM/GT/2001/U1103]CBZ30353.1 conserved hypothetical protein [Leishmania mexicana MHOM/GT/2001/U1103]
MGFGTRSCMVFCYLNGVCAVFISYLFKIGIDSMAITSVINKWDRQEKARACRNAGILYLILAVAVTVKDAIDTCRERRLSRGVGQRMAEYGMADAPADAAETVPLLECSAYVHGKGTRGRSVARRGGSDGGGYGGAYY